jgi:sulfite exporter TauE/SafE
MTDTPPVAARSRTPSAQLVALMLLGVGSYAILGVIIWLVVTQDHMVEPVRLLLSNVATAIISVLLTIAGFYFGASLKQTTPTGT